MLEQQRMLRVGGVTLREIEVRFVAATNRDLVAEVRARRFREGLYWEVSVQQPDLEAAAEALKAAGGQSVSTRVAACETCSRGHRAFVVLDPDGHAIRLVGD